MMTEKVQQESVGHQLREARLKKQLTPQSVAEQMNLHKRIIVALEADEFDALPLPLFTRGYIRSYAKLVELNGDDLVDQYNQQAPPDPELVSAAEIIKETESNHLTVRWTTLVIAVVICMLLAFWWVDVNYSNVAGVVGLKTESDSTESKTEQIETADNTVVQTTAPEAAETMTAQAADTDLTNEAEASEFDIVKTTATESNEEISPAVTVAETEEDNSTEYVENAAVETVSNTDEDIVVATVESSNDSQAESLSQTTIDTTNIFTAPVGDDVLSISTETETWVEVVDANGALLLYDVINGTQSFDLQGTAPFQIFLGNTPGISLQVNDIQLETPAYNTISKISRFFVEADGTQRR